MPANDLLAARLRARLPFAKFIPAVRSDWMEPKHLARYTDIIERVDAGERVRALVSAPPRHAKTSITQCAPIWLLKRNPRLRILYCTASDTLASTKSREARGLANAAGLELASENLGEWTTRESGGVVFVGAGGSINGRGFNVLLVDDLIPNAEAANSETQRAGLLSWWQTTLVTRCEPNASIVVLGTRWRENDIMATLAAEPSWEVINLQAINDDGEPLWPERFSLEELAIRRAEAGSYAWEAMYQGRPSSPEGNVFQRRHLVPGPMPQLESIVLSVDGAWKTGIGNDFSAIGTWGLGVGAVQPDLGLDDNDPLVAAKRALGLYRHMEAAAAATLTAGPAWFGIKDQWRGRTELPGLIGQIKTIADLHRPVAILIENSASGIAAIQVLKATTSLPVIAIDARASKRMRAEAVSPLFEAGLVRIATGPWNSDWIEEHANFPNGQHDDQVDCTSMALAYLKEVVRRSTRRQGARPADVSLYGR